MTHSAAVVNYYNVRTHNNVKEWAITKFMLGCLVFPISDDEAVTWG